MIGLGAAVLPNDRAAAVLQYLPDELAVQVCIALASMEGVFPETLGEIDEVALRLARQSDESRR